MDTLATTLESSVPVTIGGSLCSGPFLSVCEMLAQSDKVGRLSSHRQRLTPSSLVGVGLVEAVPFGLDWCFWFWFVCLLTWSFDTKSCFEPDSPASVF